VKKILKSYKRQTILQKMYILKLEADDSEDFD